MGRSGSRSMFLFASVQTISLSRRSSDAMSDSRSMRRIRRMSLLTALSTVNRDDRLRQARRQIFPGFLRSEDSTRSSLTSGGGAPSSRTIARHEITPKSDNQNLAHQLRVTIHRTTRAESGFESRSFPSNGCLQMNFRNLT